VFRIGVEVVVLACTELPMIPVTELRKQEGRAPAKVLIVDPAVLLAEALLDFVAQPLS
jgi:aspartate/glutamate racemase